MSIRANRTSDTRHHRMFPTGFNSRWSSFYGALAAVLLIVALACSGKGSSNEGQGIPGTPVVTAPAAPANLAATAGDAQVSLTWTASARASAYHVQRATASGGPYTEVAAPSGTSYTNTGLTNNTPYYYVVTASNAAGKSGNSNEASATPAAPTTAPAAPTNLVATAGNGQVSLSWTASATATGYFVLRGAASGGPYTKVFTTAISGTSYTNTGLTNNTPYYFVVTASNSAGESGNSNQASATPTQTSITRNLGINFFYNADWDPAYIFADVVKQGRAWTIPGQSPDTVSIDANGWPTADADILVLIKADNGGYDASGVYKLRFEASTPNVTLEAPNESPSGSVTISNQVYNAGVIAADVTLSPSATNLTLGFRNTGNGVRNVTVMRPGHILGTDTFAHDMLDATGIFGTYRPMQMVAEPFNPVVNWADRRRATWPQQSNDDAHLLGSGVAYEWLVALANAAHKDLWLCLPRLANDDYITKVAQLCRYGSDGVTPYTSTQANPAFAPLDPNLNLYIEFSNETWNYTLNEETALAVAEQNAGDPYHYNYDNSNNQWYWGHARTAYKIVRISNLFRSVFGDSQMPLTGTSRIRPVLATQIDYANVYRIQLEYTQAVWGPSNTFGNPQHPVNYYLYALSGAPYPTFNSTSDTLTVDAVFAGLNNSLTGTGPNSDGWNVFDMIDDLKNAADTYGLQMVAYEGSESLWQNGHSDAAKAAAQADPRMKQYTKDLLNKWYSVTDGVFIYFTLGQSSDYFPLGLGYADTDTPKWQALKEVAAGQ